MENPVQKSRIKPIYAYIKESIKFYDVDRPIVAQVIFVLQLAFVFFGYVIARPYTEKFFLYYEQITNKLVEYIESKNYDLLPVFDSEVFSNLVNVFIIMMSIYLISKAISYILGVFYGAYYYMSLTSAEKSLSQKISDIIKKYHKVIIFNVLFYTGFSIAAVLLTITVVVASYIMPMFLTLAPLLPFLILTFETIFMFKNLLIFEFDVGVFRNFKKSWDITEGCKRKIIVNGLWPVCLGLLLGTFSIGLENQLLALFILAFFEIIIHLITQRLTALMFIDAAGVERNDKKTEEVKKAD